MSGDGGGTLDRTLGVLAVGGAAGLAGFMAGGGVLSFAALLAATVVVALGAAAWTVARRWVWASGRRGSAAWACATAPLLPWLAAGAALLATAGGPVARQQLVQSRVGVALYLAVWLVAGMAALRLWLAVERDVGRRAAMPRPVAMPWPVVAPLVAAAALAYWNGAVLDPLQFRGFPDYVTQMLGARRLMAGALPYDPALPVWKDVNLPPVTLLLLFAPFLTLADGAGRLTYFAINHAAFLGGLLILLLGTRAAQPSGKRDLLRLGLIAALALAFEPWHDSQRLGQQNGIVFLLLAGSAIALVHRRDWLSGAALALALIGKPSSALLGVYLLFTGRWQALAAAATTGLAVFVLTLPWTGFESWRFYLLEKAPQILAGTPQQSNVALLALHARLFLPREVLSSFEPMPDVPVAQALTRAAQLVGALALWRAVRAAPGGEAEPWRSRRALLEFGLTMVLSLSLVGHAWQSYVTWLIIAFVPLADPAVWAPLSGRWRWLVVGLSAACYVSLALDDVALYKVIGETSAGAAVFASLPSVALLAGAYVLALLLHAGRRAAALASETG